MSKLHNVTIIRESNVYFDGNVTSRTVLFADGSKKTLGIMQPGDYTFDTAAAERMEILAGELEVLLPGTQEWRTVRGGEVFEVPANAVFQLKVRALADYCCSYLT